MATLRETSIKDLHAFGNRTDVQIDAPGYDIANSDPYELKHLIANTDLTSTDTQVQAVSAFAVTSGTTGALTFTYTDANNTAGNIESYAVYIWSSALQDGQYFYRSSDGTNDEQIIAVTGLTPGASYDVQIEAEPFTAGINTPITVATGSPVTISA